MEPETLGNIGKMLILLAAFLFVHLVVHSIFTYTNHTTKNEFDTCLGYIAVVESDRLDLVKEICAPYYPTKD